MEHGGMEKRKEERERRTNPVSANVAVHLYTLCHAPSIFHYLLFEAHAEHGHALPNQPLSAAFRRYYYSYVDVPQISIQ